MRKILKTGLIISMMLCILVGCGNGNVASNNKDITKKTATLDTINVEDIDWDVKKRIDEYNNPYLSFDYTNNTDYYIVAVLVKFIPKEDVTNEQLKVFNTVIDEEDIWDKDNLYILGYSLKHAEKGETAEDAECLINGSSYIPDNMKQYELMEASTINVTYIGSDNMVYRSGYDYKNGEKIETTQIGEPYNWIDNDISKYVPKPKAPTVEAEMMDGDESFCFNAYGVNKKMYNNYIEECKNKGYINEVKSYSNGWEATNDNGYRIDISYRSKREIMTCTIK